jgi:hypothetical protein
MGHRFKSYRVSKSPDGVAVALKTESSSVDDFSKSLSNNFLWKKKALVRIQLWALLGSMVEWSQCHPVTVCGTGSNPVGAANKTKRMTSAN